MLRASKTEESAQLGVPAAASGFSSLAWTSAVSQAMSMAFVLQGPLRRKIPVAEFCFFVADHACLFRRFLLQRGGWWVESAVRGGLRTNHDRGV